jgi:hypothetical protein
MALRQRVIQPNDLDVFSTLPVQTSIIGDETIEYFPINPITATGPIQFDVPASYSQLMDPAFMIYVTAKVTKADGNAIAAGAAVAPTNYAVHSCFRSVAVKLNNALVALPDGCYSYRAYFEANYVLSQAAKTALLPEMYVQETRSKFNSTVAKDNPSFDERKVAFSASQEVSVRRRVCVRY